MYHCGQCNLLVEHSEDYANSAAYKRCQSKGHQSSVVTVLKNYFECFQCLTKVSTLTQVTRPGGNSNNTIINPSSGSSAGSSSGSSSVNGSPSPKILIKPPAFNCQRCHKATWVQCGKQGSYVTGGAVGKSGDILEKRNEEPVGNGISGVSTINYFDR